MFGVYLRKKGLIMTGSALRRGNRVCVGNSKVASTPAVDVPQKTLPLELLEQGC